MMITSPIIKLRNHFYDFSSFNSVCKEIDFKKKYINSTSKLSQITDLINEKLL